MAILNNLPYALNALNPMRLLRISAGRVQIGNNNINSTLQHILQNCNFIEDIIFLVSAQLCMSDLTSVRPRIVKFGARFCHIDSS